MPKLNVEEQVKRMKAWCVKNYEKGADTMVECWDDDSYRSLIADAKGDFKKGMYILKSVADVYYDRICDAENSIW